MPLPCRANKRPIASKRTSLLIIAGVESHLTRCCRVEYQVNQRVRLLRAQASTNRSVPFASLLADEVEVPVESLESYLFDIGIDGWIENDRGDMRIHLAFDPSDIETRPCRPCNDANSTN